MEFQARTFLEHKDMKHLDLSKIHCDLPDSHGAELHHSCTQAHLPNTASRELFTDEYFFEDLFYMTDNCLKLYVYNIYNNMLINK